MPPKRRRVAPYFAAILQQNRATVVSAPRQAWATANTQRFSTRERHRATSGTMRRALPVMLLSLLSACGARNATEAPATSSETAAAETTSSEPSGPSATTPSEESSPRAAQASRGSTVVTLTDTPGPLVDGNAPPPPPGSAPSRHAAVTASCSGDALGCSEAGVAVRAATSFDDALDRLEALGFDIATE